MQKISVLLERFKRFSRPDIQIREAVSKAIKNEIGADVPEKDISVKGGVVYIKTYNSILKNEIVLKKKKILDDIQNLFPTTKVNDIK